MFSPVRPSTQATAQHSKPASTQRTLSPSRTLPGNSAHGRTLRVLCVDDHAVLVEGLAARFALDGGIELVGQLPSAATLLDAVQQQKPDVVILDIEMPGPDAFEMADRLKRQHTDVRIVVLSAHIRNTFVAAAFRAGASAYFAKSDDLNDIIRGIYEVSRSPVNSFTLGPKVREYCRPLLPADPHTPSSAAAIDRPAADAPAGILSSLTPRESEILRAIGRGLSRTQIARELCRSAKTVDAHQARMMKKLGLDSRAELMRLAIREGLAEA